MNTKKVCFMESNEKRINQSLNIWKKKKIWVVFNWNKIMYKGRHGGGGDVIVSLFFLNK